MTVGRNIDLTADEASFIRALGDFDLKMFLSELNDHGWEAARKLLPLILEAILAQATKENA